MRAGRQLHNTVYALLFTSGRFWYLKSVDLQRPGCCCPSWPSKPG